MIKRFFCVVALTALLGSPVLAGQCPADMSKIDEALAAGPQISDEDLAMVKELRAQGEEQHSSGQHAESVETLGKAKALLGIE